MADSTVTVELIAKIDQLIAGMSEASVEVKTALESIKGDLSGLNESAKESEGALKDILSIESFKLSAEIATEALEKVKEAFESTVGKAEEFGLSTEKFASRMGISTEQAAGLSAALENVGSSTDAYETIAIRLGASLEKAGGASEELKSQFKDANGNFLTGADLMDRLKTVTDSYEEGAARTAVTTALLGKQTKSYYDIARVTAEAAEHQTAIYKSMGVDFATLGEKSRQLEDAEGDLRTAWKAETVVIGQELMPVAMAAMQWMGGDGKALLEDCGTAVKFLMSTFLLMKVAVVDAVVALTATFVELWDAIKLSGNVVFDVISGNWKAVSKDAKAGTTEMANDFSAAIKTMGDESNDFTKTFNAMWSPDKAHAAASKPTGKAAPHNLYASQEKKGKEDRGPEDAIQADEKLAQARIALEESTNQHLLAMGQESVEDFVAQQVAIENETYRVKADALGKELALSGRSKLERQKTLDEMGLLEVTHQNKLVELAQDAEKRISAQDKEQVSAALQSDDAELANRMESIKRLVAAGEIGIDEELAQQKRLTLQIRDEELSRLDDELAMLTRGTVEYDKALEARRKLSEKFTKDVTKLEDEHRAKVAADVTQATNAMTKPFSTAIQEMTAGTKSFADSMKGIFVGMADSFAQMVAEMVDKWAIGQITNALVTQTSGLAQISTNAGVAASAAASSQAGIPIVGPILAIAAATAMEGFVLGLGSLAHASGGMVLDHDQLVYAHANEMILPAHLSRGVQNMISGGNTSNTGGATSLTMHNTINAPQAEPLDSMLRTQGNALLGFLKQARRDGRI